MKLTMFLLMPWIEQNKKDLKCFVKEGLKNRIGSYIYYVTAAICFEQIYLSFLIYQLLKLIN